jgi:hypothetical protein
MDKVGDLLAVVLPTGVPSTYAAQVKHSRVGFSALYYRARGLR